MHALLPPPCLLDMEGEFLEYEDGVCMSLRFPVLARYRNPMGNMQGGFIIAALGNTLGPLSYLIAPSVTATLNTQYLRPVAPQTTSIIYKARLVGCTRNVLHLAAEARSEDGKGSGLCQATQQILPSRTA